MLTFDALVALLVRGHSMDGPGFSGIRSDLREDGSTKVSKVWRHGRLARIEEPPGQLVLIAGEHTYWRKWPVDAEVREFDRSAEYDDFDLSAVTQLDPEGYWREWLDADRPLVERTLAETVHEGRPAWRFVAPFVKGGTPELTVDAELGIVLRAWRDDIGDFQTWTEVRTEDVLDPSLFGYDGTWQ